MPHWKSQADVNCSNQTKQNPIFVYNLVFFGNEIFPTWVTQKSGCAETVEGDEFQYQHSILLGQGQHHFTPHLCQDLFLFCDKN